MFNIFFICTIQTVHAHKLSFPDFTSFFIATNSGKKKQMKYNSFQTKKISRGLIFMYSLLSK